MAETDSRFHQRTVSEQAQVTHVKDLGKAFQDYLQCLGDSRELSIAKTKAEEAMMWATKHLTK